MNFLNWKFLCSLIILFLIIGCSEKDNPEPLALKPSLISLGTAVPAYDALIDDEMLAYADKNHVRSNNFFTTVLGIMNNNISDKAQFKTLWNLPVLPPIAGFAMIYDAEEQVMAWHEFTSPENLVESIEDLTGHLKLVGDSNISVDSDIVSKTINLSLAEPFLKSISDVKKEVKINTSKVGIDSTQISAIKDNTANITALSNNLSGYRNAILDSNATSLYTQCMWYAKQTTKVASNELTFLPIVVNTESQQTTIPLPVLVNKALSTAGMIGNASYAKIEYTGSESTVFKCTVYIMASAYTDVTLNVNLCKTSGGVVSVIGSTDMSLPAFRPQIDYITPNSGNVSLGSQDALYLSITTTKPESVNIYNVIYQL